MNASIKKHLVYCKYPEQYEIFDERINKPFYYQKFENGEEVGSMVSQEMDEIAFKNNPFEFFAPNNVALLMSVSERYLKDAKLLYKKSLDPKTVDHSIANAIDKKRFLQENSILAADYIELIQIAIVFSYTAIEAFVNLSIPEGYRHEVKVKNKGITEIYDKDAIERWITLSEKMAQILPIIYQTPKVEDQKFWSNFKTLEKQRNSIIHQKSVLRTELYKEYFHENIFKIIESASLALQFYYDSRPKNSQPNALWPWAIGKERIFVVKDSADLNNVSVIGNIHEGTKKMTINPKHK